MRAASARGAAREGAPGRELAAGGAPLRVAIVGCGAVTRLYYVPTLRRLERGGEVRVCAFVDPDPVARAGAARAFPSAASYRALDELPVGEMDLGIIASPPGRHAEQAIQLLRSGVAVLCEKPMAESHSEAAAMVEAADTAGRMLAVAMVRRFLPATRFIRDVLMSGALGPSVRVVCREGGPFRWPIHSLAYFRGRGGGVLLDLGVHALDLLTWWLGAPDEVEYADDAMGGVEANCSIHLRFPGGSIAEVRLSRDTAQPGRYAFHGGRGWLTWDVHEPDGLQLGFHEADHALGGRMHEVRSGRDAAGRGGDAGGFLEAFAAQLRNAVGAARGTGNPAVTGRDALSTAFLLEECRARRSLLPMPWLGEAEQREAQRLGGGAR